MLSKVYCDLTEAWKSMLHYFRETDSLMTTNGNSGKLCHMLSVTLTIQRPYMAYSGKLRNMLSMTLTIQQPYMACLGKLCNMLSMTLMIQRPYMVIQENFVTCFP